MKQKSEMEDQIYTCGQALGQAWVWEEGFELVFFFFEMYMGLDF